ncbi:MAG: glycosyltransferase [Cyanobacteria bacterium J06598_3]
MRPPSKAADVKVLPAHGTALKLYSQLASHSQQRAEVPGPAATNPLPTNQSPTVSLVMTVYNTEAYLAEALASVLAQTYTDWELIVWDDGSTDSSAAIAQTFAQRDRRIRFHAGEQNIGQGPALLKAHALAKGTYVGWLDADDILAPAALQATVEFLETHADYGMVYTSYIDMDEGGKHIGLGARCQIPYSPQRMLVDLLTFHFRLVRRSVYTAVGGFNPAIKCAEDYDLFLRISEACPIHHLDQPLYFYRANTQGLSYQRQLAQRQGSEQAVNLALQRRGLSATVQLHVDPETGRFHLQRRKNNPQAAADSVKALFKQGKQQVEQDELVSAIATYEQLLTLAPNMAQAHCNLGAIWQLQGKMDEAIAAYQQSIALKPAFAIAHLNLAKLLTTQGRPAKPHYQGVVEANPTNPETQLDAHYGLGKALLNEGQLDAAEACFQKVLALDTSHAAVLFDLGRLSEAQGNLTNARQYYQQLFDHHPTFQNIAAYQLAYVRRQLCDWSDHNAHTADLQQRIQQQIANPQNPPLAPLSLSIFPAAPALHKAVNEHYAAHVQQRVADIQQRCNFQHSKAATTTLNIGYVSGDFRNHPVGWLVQDLFQHHDRQQFQVFAYSLRPDEDDVQKTVKAGVDHFVECSTLSPEEIARRIYRDRIHILIDLAGYTTYSCPEIFALRPAPIQCSYLGYPDTTGAPYIDYLLTDDQVVPPALATHCSEEVIWLPHQFVIPPDFSKKTTEKISPSDRKAFRKRCGLSKAEFVFCCFNTHRKIDPTVFDHWMRILAQVPGAVLWLSDGPEESKANLRQCAQSHNVDPERLVFAPKVSFNDYLAQYACADVFLDTFAYSAGSTAVCALAAGVPLLTYPQEINASRMGASLCRAAGLNSLICESLAAYEQKAIYLATHPEVVLFLQEGLRENCQKLPLFQPEQWINHLETVCWNLWRKWQAV